MRDLDEMLFFVLSVHKSKVQKAFGCLVSGAAPTFTFFTSEEERFFPSSDSSMDLHWLIDLSRQLSRILV